MHIQRVMKRNPTTQEEEAPQSKLSNVSSWRVSLLKDNKLDEGFWQTTCLFVFLCLSLLRIERAEGPVPPFWAPGFCAMPPAQCSASSGGGWPWVNRSMRQRGHWRTHWWQMEEKGSRRDNSRICTGPFPSQSGPGCVSRKQSIRHSSQQTHRHFKLFAFIMQIYEIYKYKTT